MPKLGFGADKTTYDNIDWDGFGVGSNVATVDVKDGKILRVRRFIWDSADKPLLVSNQYVFTDEWEYEADFTMMM